MHFARVALPFMAVVALCLAELMTEMYTIYSYKSLS